MEKIKMFEAKKMDNLKIAVIDIETPNSNNDSICSIGIVIVENDTIVDKQYYLINPETHFDTRNIHIHGITEKDVQNAPTFPVIWKKIKCYFSGYLLAGHNFSFDLSCIKKAMKKYDIKSNPAYYIDTLKISREIICDIEDYRLNTLCDYFGINLLKHHNALEDSYATAELLSNIMRGYKIDINDFITKYEFDVVETCNYHKQNFSYQTKSLQELQGILLGVTCDGILSDKEIFAIQSWIKNHQELKGNFPFDKIYSSIEQVLFDNIITENERQELFKLFNNILNPVNSIKPTKCICIDGAKICLSGDFECMTKSELSKQLESQGAIIKNSVVKDLKYLVIGNKGSERWAQGNYGTKVKKAMEFNEKGCRIEIIKETDFISSVIDE